MRIAVIGAGGVGGYFGGRLASVGEEVTFVARGAQFDAIRQNGLTILSGSGDLRIHPARVVDDIAKLGHVDLVLITVKLWDTEDVARAVKPLADQGAAVLSFQNGVEKDEILRRHIAPESIIGGVCYIGAAITSPGVITHTGKMQRLVFGDYTGQHSALIKDLVAACSRAAIDVESTDSIERLIWEKFVFLVGLSGATAAMRQPLGPIVANTQTRAFLLGVMSEVVMLGRAKGVALREDYAEDRLAFCDSLPAAMTSSMHNDLMSGNRLELPWLSGAVARLGDAMRIPTPLNHAITDILALYSSGRRP